MRVLEFPIETGDGPRFLAIARAVSDAITSGRLETRRCAPRKPRARSRSRRESQHGARGARTSCGSKVGSRRAAARDVRELASCPVPRAPRGEPKPRRDDAKPAFDLRGDEPSATGRALVRGVFAEAGAVPAPRGHPRRARGAARGARARVSARARDTSGRARVRRSSRRRVAAARAVGAARADTRRRRGRGRARRHARQPDGALSRGARDAVAPGDVVAVEAYGYRPAWEAFRLAGAELVPVPVDAEGLRVDALEKLTPTQRRVRAVYVTPHHQYPTTAMLPAARRLALLELGEARAASRSSRTTTITSSTTRADRCCRSRARTTDRASSTWGRSRRCSRRVFASASSSPRERSSSARRCLRAFVDRQGDLAIERAVAELIDDGVLARHTRKMRRLYRERRDVLARALEKHLPSWRFSLPPGGLAIWVSAPAKTDVDALAARAEKRGVLVHTARRFTFDGHAESRCDSASRRSTRRRFARPSRILTSVS